MPGDFTPRLLKADGHTLSIEWSDGACHHITWRVLRDECPCATCRDRRSQPAPASPLQIIKPEEAAPVRGTGMRPVGNYAYQIDFSDGHKTGIYPLELLRELGAREESNR